jgi:O-antigen/teichoic acid export membrane protein
MNNKVKNLLKTLYFFSLGSMSSKLISFLMIPLYTFTLSPQSYGLLDLLQSTVYFLLPLFLLSIQDATMRFSLDDNYQKKDVISSSINIVFFGSTLLAFFLIFLILLNVVKLNYWYLIFIYFSFLLNATNNIFIFYLKANGYANVIATGGILSSVFIAASNLLLLLVFKMEINGYLISYILGLSIQFIYMLVRGNLLFDIKLTNYLHLQIPMIKYSTPLVFNSIAWWINNVSDRYFITFILGISFNGIYSIANKLTSIIALFQGIFFNAWSVSAIKEFDTNDSDSFIGNNYTLYSFLSLALTSILILLNIPIARILYHGDFFIAWKSVPFLLFAVVFNGISQFLGSLYAAVKKTKTVAMTTIAGGVINILMNLTLIPIIGLIGAAIGTFLGYFIIWGIRLIKLAKFIKIKVNWKIHFLSFCLVFIQTILGTLNIFLLFQIFLSITLLLVNSKVIYSIYRNFIKI